MRTLLPAVIVTGTLLLSGCDGSSTGQAETSPDASSSAIDEVLAAHDLDGLDAEGLIERLDRMPLSERPEDLRASVEPDRLVLSSTADPAPRELELPDELFYLSFAPYAEQTHDCYFHSLTTCLGELRAEELQLTITEQTTGEVLVDDTVTSYDNGFVGVWLPRDTEVRVEVQHEDRSGDAVTPTGPDDPTCLTGPQLS